MQVIKLHCQATLNSHSCNHILFLDGIANPVCPSHFSVAKVRTAIGVNLARVVPEVFAINAFFFVVFDSGTAAISGTVIVHDGDPARYDALIDEAHLDCRAQRHI